MRWQWRDGAVVAVCLLAAATTLAGCDVAAGALGDAVDRWGARAPGFRPAAPAGDQGTEPVIVDSTAGEVAQQRLETDAPAGPRLYKGTLTVLDTTFSPPCTHAGSQAELRIGVGGDVRLDAGWRGECTSPDSEDMFGVSVEGSLDPSGTAGTLTDCNDLGDRTAKGTVEIRAGDIARVRFTCQDWYEIEGELSLVR